MGCERIEIHIQTITGEEWKATRGQMLSQGVDEQVGHVLCAWTELEDGKNLGERIDGQPQPEHLCGAAQPGSDFVQLEVRDVEVAEAALMEGLSMLACTSEPGGDGRLPVAEDPLGSRSIQSFGKGREHYGDLAGRGFQPVQWGVAPSGEGGVTGLAAKRLAAFGHGQGALGRWSRRR